MNRVSCGALALLWLLLIPILCWPQVTSFKSIHALEAEAHREVSVSPVWEPVLPQPLSPDTPSNLTRTVFGFYPYWVPGFTQIRFQDLTHLAIFSLEADGTGQLVNLRGWPNVPLISAAHQANVRVVPVCTLFNSGQLAQLLSSGTARQTLIGNLCDQVLLGGADGVNIDFEGVPASQRDNVVTFMRDLAVTMRAALPGAHISMDTPAVDWSGAWDYAALAEICDALMIMAYDYHWSGSANPGPVSPLAGSNVWGKYCVLWTMADYLGKVGAGRSSKLILGVPYYGYDWPAQSEALNAITLPGSVQSKTYKVAAGEADTYGRRWDDFSSTPWYFYTSNTPHQVWYDDAASLSLKYDLVLQNGLQGIGIWALTYDRERTELWELIEDRFLAPTAPDPPEITAPATFFDTRGLPVALRERGSIPAGSFEVAVGTTSGGTELSGFKSVGLRHQVLIRELTLASGSTYYVMARSVGKTGIAGLPSVPVPIRIDASQPVTRRYLPRWISDNNLYTGLALVNLASATRAILLRGHVSGQAGAIETAWVVKPGEQLAQIVSQQDLLGSQIIGREGWMELVYQADEPPGMYIIGDTRASGILAGSPLLDAATKQILPLLDQGRAKIIVANPGNAAAEVDFRLKGTLVTVAPKHITLTPGELSVLQVSDIFSGSADLWQIPYAGPPYFSYPAFVEAQSNLPVICTTWLQRERDAAAVPGLNAAQPLTSGAFSYFVAGGGYVSQAVIVNPTAELQTVEFASLASKSGFSGFFQVAPMSSSAIDLGAWMAYPRGTSPTVALTGAVSLKVTSGSGVLGSIWIRSEDYKLMAALPLEPATSTSYNFPQLAQAQGYWTGLSVTNLGGREVVAEAFDAGGNTIGTAAIPFGADNTWVGLVYQLIPATLGVSSGRVLVRSTGPLLAAQIFGSDTLSFMAAVPGK